MLEFMFFFGHAGIQPKVFCLPGKGPASELQTQLIFRGFETRFCCVAQAGLRCTLLPYTLHQNCFSNASCDLSKCAQNSHVPCDNATHCLFVFTYRLSPGNCPFLEKKELHEAHPWLEFLVQCRQVSSNLTGIMFSIKYTSFL